MAEAAFPALPPPLAAGFPPSSSALLDLLRARMDDEMLDEISRADYGEDAADHLRALRDIRDWGRVPAPMEGVPKEVLELFRWSEPENPEWKPGATGTRGHLMRAFSCAALLRAAAEPANAGYFDGENSTLAQLVSSALVLGREVQVAAARFLTWRIPGMRADEERPFFAFALLLLAVLLREDRFPDAVLADAAEWMLAEEAAEFAALHPGMIIEGAPWLLRLTFTDSRHAVWRAFAERLADEADALSEAAREPLQMIALQLLD